MGASFSSIDWQVGDGWQPLIDAWRAGADALALLRACGVSAAQLREIVEADSDKAVTVDRARARVSVGRRSVVVAGIVGGERYQFDIWGDTVNMAARLTSAALLRSNSGAIDLVAKAICD